MITKPKLAITLSKLKVFENPKLLEEQYPVDSEIAAELLWFAYMNKDIEEKFVADFGCGTGLLGIGALLLGAKKVVFIDSDNHALGLLRENLAAVEKNPSFAGEAEIINSDISDFSQKADVVIQNPPFGTKTRHADKVFIEKAFETAKVIYSFHKLVSVEFVRKIAEDHKFEVTHLFRFSFPLKRTQMFHRKRIHRIDVGCWRLEKKR